MQIDTITSLTKNNPWKTAIVIRKNNQTIFQNSLADTTFKAASLIKLGIALYIQEKAADTTTNSLILSSDDIVGGAGIINRLNIRKWQINELIDLMLSLSDNTATNALLHYYGITTINDFLQHNFTDISLGRFLMKKGPQENTCTASSIMNVFEKIFQSNNTVNKVILRALRHQQVRNKLVAYSNPQFETFNKTGELLHEQHDIARFKLNDETIDCCILTDYTNQTNYESILKMMHAIGKMLTN